MFCQCSKTSVEWQILRGYTQTDIALTKPWNSLTNLLHKISVSDIVATLSAPCPSGKGEVCKTFIHQFDSDRRLLSLKSFKILRSLSGLSIKPIIRMHN